MAVVNSSSYRNKHPMQLMHCLFFFATHFHFLVTASHTPGSQIVQADALSHNNLSLFLSLRPPGFPSAHTSASRASPIIGSGQPRLDLSALEATVKQLFKSGIGPSIQCSNESAQRRFLSFCNRADITPFPVFEESDY